MGTFAEKRSQLFMDYLMLVFASLLISLNVVVFARPAAIPLGGPMGLSLILNYFVTVPVGTVSLAINVPLFFVGFRILGPQFFTKTVFSTIIINLGIDFLDLIGCPAFSGDRMLSAIFGGVLCGIGIGIIFTRGGTPGGNDIIAKLINRKTDISVGSISYVLNAVVMIAGALTYGGGTGGNVIESLLYALVFQFVIGFITDSVINGVDSSNAAFIVTEKPDELSTAIGAEFGRGLTALSSMGMYTKNQRTTLLCAVRRHEMVALKNIINSVDPSAFVIVANVKEVLGRGFKTHTGK